MADPRVAPATKGVAWKKCCKHNADEYELRIVLLTVLAFALQPSMGEKPWFNEQPDHVVFRSKICQPVTSANLKNMMGSNFDNKIMALDKKHGIMSGDTEGFQEENSNIAEEDKLWKFDESAWVDQREENVLNNAGVAKEKFEAKFVKSRMWLPQRKVLNRHADNYTQPMHSDTYKFMHRRRRQSHSNMETRSQATDYNIKYRGRSDYPGDSVNNKENNNDDSSIDAKDRKATNNILLELFFSGKDKKQRRKLKHELRQSQVDLNKSPPWQCEFRQRKQRMNKDMFPEWVLEGRCETGKCFYGLYNCVPIKYTLKLLQRDPTKCNPLPSITNVTVYEERWELVRKHVTVGCNCGTSSSRT